MIEFYVPYVGNKTSEFNEIYEYMNLDNIKIFVEPFCGSATISANLFFVNDDIKFILNDIDHNLIKFLKYVKNNNKILLVPKINKIMKKYNNHEKYKKYFRDFNHEKLSPAEYVAHRIFTSSTVGYFGAYKNGKLPQLKKFKKEIEYDYFIKSNRVEIFNKSYNFMFRKYKNNSKAFLFLDPPYVDTYNKIYIVRKNSDVMNINNDIFDFMTNKHTKCKVMLVVISNEYYKTKFKNLIKATYIKIYMGNKKLNHLIITNYDI
jgi:DNA adenine methylase